MATIVEAAKKEVKVVAAIPPSQDFRKELEVVFQPKFGIVLELVPARGAQKANGSFRSSSSSLAISALIQTCLSCGALPLTR